MANFTHCSATEACCLHDCYTSSRTKLRLQFVHLASARCRKAENTLAFQVRACLPSAVAIRTRGIRRPTWKCQASSSQVPTSWGGKGPSPTPVSSGTGNGVFVLMLLCCLVFIVDNLLHLPGATQLHLNHARGSNCRTRNGADQGSRRPMGVPPPQPPFLDRPQWWQFVTHMFCHGNWAHLSGNLFNLCVFGKMVEETEGSSGVATAFIICGLGAALATFLLTPATTNGHVTVSVGASGAIFGLFAVSVVTRLRWNLKQLLEAAVLGQFVVRQVLEEAKNQVSGGLMVGGLAVSHVAHLAGAVVGVLLVLLLQRLPDPGAGEA